MVLDIHEAVEAKLSRDFWRRLDWIDPVTLEARQKSIDLLSTFARDRNINLPLDVQIEELTQEGRH